LTNARDLARGRGFATLPGAMHDHVAWLCLLLGGLVLLIGWALLQPDADDERRRKRILRGKTTRIRDAADDTVIEIRGRVTVDDPASLLVAPFSKREVVWVRVDIDETKRSAMGAWEVRVPVHDRTRCIPFFLDDGSGTRARVSLDDAHVLLPRQLVMDQTPLCAAPPEALAYLGSAGIAALDRADTEKKLWFYERAIRVGDELLVVGRARPERTSIEDYRTADRCLHLTAGVGPDDELVVTKLTEARLLASVRPSRPLGWSFTVLGALALVAGVIAVVRG
jgi:hypothetical protein